MSHPILCSFTQCYLQKMDTIPKILIYLIVCMIFMNHECMSKDVRRVACLYSEWAEAREGMGQFRINDISGSLCTHIVHTYHRLDDEFRIDSNETNFRKLIRIRKRNPHLKFIISAGGWNELGFKFSKMAADRQNRQTFIASVVELIKTFGFDGFQLFWVYPGVEWTGGTTGDIDNLVDLMEELRTAFDGEGKGWELTIQAPIDRGITDKAFYYETICEIVDFVDLMTYDLRGGFNSFVDIPSPLVARPHDQGQEYFRNYNVKNGAQLWLNNGCPAEKLVIGIGMFGRGHNLTNTDMNYIGAPSLGHAVNELVETEGIFGYYEVCPKLTDKSWTQKWDDIGKGPYMYKEDTWIGYENEKSIEIKMDWIKSSNFAGVFVMALDLDDFKGVCGPKYPLLKTIREALLEDDDDCGDVGFSLCKDLRISIRKSF